MGFRNTGSRPNCCGPGLELLCSRVTMANPLMAHTEAGSPTMEAAHQADRRIEPLTRGADLCWVADLLAEQRADILRRWLEATAQQPFHAGRPWQAVADHIPELFDAL